ncbi:MAG: hypothetical protein IJ002_04855 [Clostridia bacterium]|nr:hypothetical protein [Clostridia bacterium]
MFRCKRKNFRTLAIIGNGFDLAHGYNTDYNSFSKNVAAPCLDEFKMFCKDEDAICTWFLFEKNINILSEKMFHQSMTEECDYESNRKKVKSLETTFREIHTLLIEYLESETSKKPINKKSAIEQYLNINSFAINFNYTKTAESYTPHIFYVHGSLKERDILLGYDFRYEACLAQYEDMRWSKTICREALEFRRFLSKKFKLTPDSAKYKTLVASLESYQHWENSGRGLENEMKKIIPYYKLIDKFVKQYRVHPIPDIDYSQIQTIVVLGHGIEADKKFLADILSSCRLLKEVVIFRYRGEQEDEFQKKESFFIPYCQNIKTVYY